MKDQFDKDLKKLNKKQETLEKQIGESTLSQGLSVKEMNSLRDQLQESLKNNASLQIKVDKFAEAAGETASLKEKTTVLKKHLKEATSELDIVATKYKEEQVKRKRLLNELEDIKGKIRVYCRIRPFSKTEAADDAKHIACFKITDEVSITVGTQKNRAKDY